MNLSKSVKIPAVLAVHFWLTSPRLFENESFRGCVFKVALFGLPPAQDPVEKRPKRKPKNSQPRFQVELLNLVATGKLLGDKMRNLSP